MRIELANDFREFELPKDVKQTIMSRNLSSSSSKMAIFADTVNLTNEDVDDFTTLKPERMDDEDFKDYKNRRYFSKQLLKHRALIYDYSNI